MRIGIDLYAFNPASSDGVSTFSIGLVEGLRECLNEENRVVILTSTRNDKFLKDRLNSDRFEFFCVPVNPFARYFNRLMWLLSFCFREFRLRYWYEKRFRRKLSRKIEANVDGLIVPTTVFNFFDLNIPTILCVHDIQQEFLPENFTLHQRALRWGSYRLSCYRAAKIQVSSAYIRNCLLEKYRFLSHEQIFFAPEGVDRSKFTPESPGIKPNFVRCVQPEKYIFYPAQIWKHKNHEYLIDALCDYKFRTGKEFACILTGSDHGHWATLEKLITQRGLESVIYLGRVDISELVWIYKHCAAVLALGLHESSSLPIREGAAFGKPLICVDIEPNVEACDYLNINIVDQASYATMADILIKLDEGDQLLMAAGVDNFSKIKELEWTSIARKYVEQIGLLKRRGLGN
ncbi:MAG: glycosyltransferase [Polynucleobacter sp.]|uniref:glycosyltransferase n=1 Tax=Polynucleobacter sp. TaxID=2029855 RepID=UPI0027241A51|nr:glycosyltransferase [Polynucleobacter sp.]MDO8713802.1 glycosyltransferase [Polynucleobacter sp.]